MKVIHPGPDPVAFLQCGQSAFRQNRRVQKPPQLSFHYFDVGLGIEQPGHAGVRTQRRFARSRFQHRLIAGIRQRDC